MTQPFDSVDAAWIWTMGALRARHEGARTKTAGAVPRPCEPDDIIKALDRLYGQGAIKLHHARVLRTYGEMGRAPDERHPAERAHAVTWREAMDAMQGALLAKGIVLPPVALAS